MENKSSSNEPVLSETPVPEQENVAGAVEHANEARTPEQEVEQESGEQNEANAEKHGENKGTDESPVESQNNAASENESNGEGGDNDPAAEHNEDEKDGDKKNHHHHHHHKHHHRKHKHKKREHPEEGEDHAEAVPNVGEESEPEPELQEERKSKATKKSGKAERDTQMQREIEVQVEKLLEEIAGAAEKDRQLKIEGKLAMEKLKLLPKIKTELKKVHLHETFLSKNGCMVLAEWIQKHADGSLPCLDILEGIIDICDNLPILPEQLRECGSLGKNVMVIFNTTESESLKMKSKRLFDKWCRSIFSIDMDYRNLPDKEYNYIQFQRYINSSRKKSSSPPRQKEGTGKMLDFEDVKTKAEKPYAKKNIVARLAETARMGFDYTVRPESEIETDGKKEAQPLSGLMKKIIQVKRDGRKKVLKKA